MLCVMQNKRLSCFETIVTVVKMLAYDIPQGGSYSWFPHTVLQFQFPLRLLISIIFTLTDTHYLQIAKLVLAGSVRMLLLMILY